MSQHEEDDDMSQHEEDDELYGDLNTIKTHTREIESQSKNASARQTHSIHSTTYPDEESMTKLQAEFEKMKKENETLRRNIGTLYRTAKMELERKDARISVLEGNMKSA